MGLAIELITRRAGCKYDSLYHRRDRLPDQSKTSCHDNQAAPTPQSSTSETDRERHRKIRTAYPGVKSEEKKEVAVGSWQNDNILTPRRVKKIILKDRGIDHRL